MNCPTGHTLILLSIFKQLNYLNFRFYFDARNRDSNTLRRSLKHSKSPKIVSFGWFVVWCGSPGPRVVVPFLEIFSSGNISLFEMPFVSS